MLAEQTVVIDRLLHTYRVDRRLAQQTVVLDFVTA